MPLSKLSTTNLDTDSRLVNAFSRFLILSKFFCATFPNIPKKVTCSLLDAFVKSYICCQVFGIESNNCEVPSRFSFNFSVSTLVSPNFFLNSSTEATNPAIKPNKRNNLFLLASLSNFLKVTPKASNAVTNS